MRRFKRWLIEKYLPMWAKQSVFAENEQLKRRLAEKEQELAELRSYCTGLEVGMRANRRITINNEVKTYGDDHGNV